MALGVHTAPPPMPVPHNTTNPISGRTDFASFDVLCAEHLMDLAHGGETLLSQQAADAVDHIAPDLRERQHAHVKVSLAPGGDELAAGYMAKGDERRKSLVGSAGNAPPPAPTYCVLRTVPRSLSHRLRHLPPLDHDPVGEKEMQGGRPGRPGGRASRAPSATVEHAVAQFQRASVGSRKRSTAGGAGGAAATINVSEGLETLPECLDKDAAPAGRVTVVCAALPGLAGLIETEGAAAASELWGALGRYVREGVENGGGEVVECTRDAVVAVFDSAGAAARWAAAASEFVWERPKDRAASPSSPSHSFRKSSFSPAPSPRSGAAGIDYSSEAFSNPAVWGHRPQHLPQIGMHACALSDLDVCRMPTGYYSVGGLGRATAEAVMNVARPGEALMSQAAHGDLPVEVKGDRMMAVATVSKVPAPSLYAVYAYGVKARKAAFGALDSEGEAMQRVRELMARARTGADGARRSLFAAAREPSIDEEEAAARAAAAAAEAGERAREREQQDKLRKQAEEKKLKEELYKQRLQQEEEDRKKRARELAKREERGDMVGQQLKSLSHLPGGKPAPKKGGVLDELPKPPVRHFAVQTTDLMDEGPLCDKKLAAKLMPEFDVDGVNTGIAVKPLLVGGARMAPEDRELLKDNVLQCLGEFKRLIEERILEHRKEAQGLRIRLVKSRLQVRNFRAEQKRAEDAELAEQRRALLPTLKKIKLSLRDGGGAPQSPSSISQLHYAVAAKLSQKHTSAAVKTFEATMGALHATVSAKQKLELTKAFALAVQQTTTALGVLHGAARELDEYTVASSPRAGSVLASPVGAEKSAEQGGKPLPPPEEEEEGREKKEEDPTGTDGEEDLPIPAPTAAAAAAAAEVVDVEQFIRAGLMKQGTPVLSEAVGVLQGLAEGYEREAAAEDRKARSLALFAPHGVLRCPLTPPPPAMREAVVDVRPPPLPPGVRAVETWEKRAATNWVAGVVERNKARLDREKGSPSPRRPPPQPDAQGNPSLSFRATASAAVAALNDTLHRADSGSCGGGSGAASRFPQMKPHGCAVEAEPPPPLSPVTVDARADRYAAVVVGRRYGYKDGVVVARMKHHLTRTVDVTHEGKGAAVFTVDPEELEELGVVHHPKEVPPAAEKGAAAPAPAAASPMLSPTRPAAEAPPRRQWIAEAGGMALVPGRRYLHHGVVVRLAELAVAKGDRVIARVVQDGGGGGDLYVPPSELVRVNTPRAADARPRQLLPQAETIGIVSYLRGGGQPPPPPPARQPPPVRKPARKPPAEAKHPPAQHPEAASEQSPLQAAISEWETEHGLAPSPPAAAEPPAIEAAEAPPEGVPPPAPPLPTDAARSPLRHSLPSAAAGFDAASSPPPPEAAKPAQTAKPQLAVPPPARRGGSAAARGKKRGSAVPPPPAASPRGRRAKPSPLSAEALGGGGADAPPTRTPRGRVAVCEGDCGVYRGVMVTVGREVDAPLYALPPPPAADDAADDAAPASPKSSRPPRYVEVAPLGQPGVRLLAAAADVAAADIAVDDVAAEAAEKAAGAEGPPPPPVAAGERFVWMNVVVEAALAVPAAGPHAAGSAASPRNAGGSTVARGAKGKQPPPPPVAEPAAMIAAPAGRVYVRPVGGMQEGWEAADMAPLDALRRVDLCGVKKRTFPGVPTRKEAAAARAAAARTASEDADGDDDGPPPPQHAGLGDTCVHEGMIGTVVSEERGVDGAACCVVLMHANGARGVLPAAALRVVTVDAKGVADISTLVEGGVYACHGRVVRLKAVLPVQPGAPYSKKAAKRLCTVASPSLLEFTAAAHTLRAVKAHPMGRETPADAALAALATTRAEVSALEEGPHVRYLNSLATAAAVRCIPCRRRKAAAEEGETVYLQRVHLGSAQAECIAAAADGSPAPNAPRVHCDVAELEQLVEPGMEVYCASAPGTVVAVAADDGGRLIADVSLPGFWCPARIPAAALADLTGNFFAGRWEWAGAQRQPLPPPAAADAEPTPPSPPPSQPPPSPPPPAASVKGADCIRYLGVAVDSIAPCGGAKGTYRVVVKGKVVDGVAAGELQGLAPSPKGRRKKGPPPPPPPPPAEARGASPPPAEARSPGTLLITQEGESPVGRRLFFEGLGVERVLMVDEHAADLLITFHGGQEGVIRGIPYDRLQDAPPAPPAAAPAPKKEKKPAPAHPPPPPPEQASTALVWNAKRLNQHIREHQEHQHDAKPPPAAKRAAPRKGAAGGKERHAAPAGAAAHAPPGQALLSGLCPEDYSNALFLAKQYRENNAKREG
eukprot:TRINITY_DN9485_c3_g1_i1.p1 TRINITY_DN9485_c3_g1~~TRINITY_DN9485_c3_g1_i1.p1  ORF type:complete len:2439 (+),score=932.12 TRINITY_DN9485_c3_g1_i1:518-7318(+)